MLFTSIPFLLFMIVAFVAIWFANEKKVGFRNVILLVFNVIFYAWWDLRMLPLLIGGAAVDYALARGIDSATSPFRRKGLLALGLMNSLGMLLILKYHGFFLSSLGDGLAAVGVPIHWAPLKLIVPVGISFYMLQRAGYLFDVYRKVSGAERDIVNFLAFTSFFPLILSGPIERSTTLLSQMRIKNEFDPAMIRGGFQLFLWGAFKKVVVADALGGTIDGLFRQPAGYSGLELAAGTILFSIQLYCDFSGYSEMAMGAAQLLGFRLMRNFANPFFSRDIAEFWRRWHISLSNWLRDYIFFPLGAGYRGKGRWIVNTMVTFAICGFWHGANWTYVIWGVLMGVYFIPLIFFNPDPKRPKTVAKGRSFPALSEFVAMAFTFAIVSFSWIFFRSESVPGAFLYLKTMFTHSWTVLPSLSALMTSLTLAGRWAGLTGAVLMVLLVEWIQRRRRFALDLAGWRGMSRWLVYTAVILLLVFSSGGGSAGFIYADF